MTLTEQKLRESILIESLKKLVSMHYDRFYSDPSDFTDEELEELEYAARISDSRFWVSIDRELEKRK
jgi:hypothetical protein